MAAQEALCSSSSTMSMGIRLVVMCAIMFSMVAAQSPISTNMPVPPLQWLKVSTLGSPPPPLKDSSIGYDDATRTLIIFGGESQVGVPQPFTYLLNLDSLSWTTPVSKVSGQSSSPPARSRSLGAGDFAANSRRDFVIYGGKGANNEALSDVWAFDYMNQFWTTVNLSGSPKPAPRWGAVGGIDPTAESNSGNNVSTTFLIAGGSDGGQAFPSSEVWQLVITGTLASDVTMGVDGLWQNKSLPSGLPGKIEAGGTYLPRDQAPGTRLVISGGCTSGASQLNPNASCVDSATYVITVASNFSFSPAQCPAPRFGPAIVPNMNPSSTSFASQAFMLLGTFDPSQWNDGGGLNKGEVAVLDADTGTWARVLPAGDPGQQGGTPMFPEPREGAASLSFLSALVGDNHQASSDTIVFGGENANGTYLNDLWILRAYNGTISQSGARWAGFGNGNLDTGVSASGAGVSVQYLSQCAQQLKPAATSSSPTSSTAQATNQPGHTGVPVSTPAPSSTFDVSVVHRILSPVSIALVLATILTIRIASPAATSSGGSPEGRLSSTYVAIPVGVLAYAVGVAGFALSLTSTTRSPSNLQRRDGTSTDTFLKTSHGQAGFALFLGLYGLVPLFALIIWLSRREYKTSPRSSKEDDTHGNDSEDTGAVTTEKEAANIRRATSPAYSAPEVHSPELSVRERRQRTQSGPGIFPAAWSGKEPSDSSAEPGPAMPTKGFEVVNRPRRASGGMNLYPPRDYPHRPAEMARSLSDISWLDRRRSLGAVGELDYALSQIGHTSPRSTSPPPTSRPPTATMSTRPFVRTPTPQPTSTMHITVWDITLHALFHAFLLANCIFTLVTLFSRAPIATFVVFLVWTLVFYVCLFLLAWNGRPQKSALVTTISRLRTRPHVDVASTTSPVDERFFHTPTPGGSPYIYHQPPWRRAVSPEEDHATRTSHGGRHTIETEDLDEDDDERQQQMEEELMRRDVNIVTVPRRKLWITNPN